MMAYAHLLDLIEGFNAAPFQAGGWEAALAGLARATGSQGGQLLGFSATAEPFFNCMTNISPEGLNSFLAAGGGLARVNPRLQAGLETAELQTLTDRAVVSPAERSRHEFYNDVLPHSGTAHFCGTTLIRDDQMMVGLAILRSAREGEIDEPQHQVFQSVAPFVRSAFRTGILLQDHGLALLTGALEALQLAVFVCDGDARVQAMTPAAETLVTGMGPLQLQAGRLSTRYGYPPRPLTELIRQAAIAAGSGCSFLIRTAEGQALTLDMVKVPALEGGLRFQPRALVVARGNPRCRDTARKLMAAAYGLTDSEAEVALLLADGCSPEAIAARRQVAVGTVRMQLKSLFGKTGAHGQVELVARLRPLL